MFSFLEPKILGCWLKINDKVFKTTTSISGETIRDKIFFQFFFKSLYFRQNFFNSGQSNSAGVDKTTVGVSRGKLWGFFIEKKRWFLISFCTLSKIIVDFCQTFTAGFPKFQSTCPEKFSEKRNEKRGFLSNFVFWVKKFGTWANKFRQDLPKVHSACLGELLEETKSSEKRLVS